MATMISFTCENCGGHGERRKSPSDSYRFCNSKCYGEYQKDSKKPSVSAANSARRGSSHPMFGKQRADMQGESNPNWKGGVSKNNRFTAEYAQWRSRVFARDNYTCQVCSQYGGYLQADHIQPYADYPELRYDVSNGRTLCMACHYFVTWKRKMPSGMVWGVTKRRMGQF
jgi:hypothetical protein